MTTNLDREPPATATPPQPKRHNAVYRMLCRLAGCEVEPAAPVGLTLLPTADVTGPGPAGLPAPVLAGRSAPAADPVVVASGLTKTYAGGVTAASGVSLTARAGETVAVVGPNGAGKSTTLNMISGLLHPTAGHATVAEVPTTDTRRLGSVLGVALQTSGLDPAMTALEHFQVQAALYGVPRAMAASRTRSLIEMFGLTPYADRQAAQFSVGLQRRLVLALSLLHDPPVLILDEPTAGLDPQSRRMVWELLGSLREEGRTIIFSTQLLEEADVLAQRLYVISDGQVVAEGTPSQLRKEYGERVLRVHVAGSLDPAAEVLAAQLPGLGSPRRAGDSLVFAVTGDGADAERVAPVLTRAGIDYLEVSFGRPSLEDAFVRLTGESVRVEPLLTMGSMGGPLCRCS